MLEVRLNKVENQMAEKMVKQKKFINILCKINNENMFNRD